MSRPSEGDERLVTRGQKGDKGDQGEEGKRGAAGLSVNVRRAVVFMFVLAVALAAIGLFWIGSAINGSHASQQRQGQLIEQRLCTTLGRLAALKPPGGPPSSNPARAYEDNLHATLAQLGPDIGCKTGGN